MSVGVNTNFLQKYVFECSFFGLMFKRKRAYNLQRSKTLEEITKLINSL